MNIERIRALQPDLILANKEENTREQIEALEKEFPVWISDIQTVEQALDMIRKVGELCDRAVEATAIAEKIQQQEVFQASTHPTQTRCVYMIWQQPWMSVNRNTFIHDVLQKLGFENACAGLDARYPELDEALLKALKPEFVLLSSEPFPFKQTHVDALQDLLPESKIMLVDGEAFSWYGSRMLKTAEYLKGLSLR